MNDGTVTQVGKNKRFGGTSMMVQAGIGKKGKIRAAFAEGGGGKREKEDTDDQNRVSKVSL